jgi:hypothetical protein
MLLCTALPPASTAGADAPAPVKIAIFDFELEDFSAGASITAGSPADAAELKLVTSEVRRLVAESGRYSLVDTRSADAEAAKTHELRNCNGCEAAIASKLGAEQSLIGVVTRISRTDYTMGMRLRDARTGAVITNIQSGLRLGADYSWNRGAASLIKNRLLNSKS